MYLLDTNILLSYPSALKDFSNQCVISIRSIEEIDKLKTNLNSEVAYKARRASHTIFTNMKNIKFELKTDRKNSVDDDLKNLAKKKNYTLVTNDLNLIIKSKAENISCETYNKVETNYTGINYIDAEFDSELYNEEIDKILSTKNPPYQMRENEFIIVRNQNQEKMFELVYKDNKLNILENFAIKNDFVNKIIPRNSEQNCLMSLLYDKNINIIAATGEYGTGKSYILTNFALQQLQKGKINKIVYVPNNSIVENTRELGTLPGDTADKELIYMGPILDIVGEIRAKEMVLNGEIEIVPISIMRGRSFNNSIVLVNEAQNLTTEHIKLLIARCGENTRIFFDGDIKQSDSSVFKNKNGLKLLLHLSESKEYSKIFGTVKLSSIERSTTAQASAYLDNFLI